MSTQLQQSFTPDILSALQDIVGAEWVKTDADDLQNYGKDWTSAYRVAPSAAVLPATIEEVQAIVRLANVHKLAVVPSGGRTGLSGGAVASNGEVVIAFDRMNNIRDFNAADRQVVCEAGVVTEQLQEFAADKGLYYPVDFASAGSSQIGGNAATNAGGIKVIRYGMTRDWITGLKVAPVSCWTATRGLPRTLQATTCATCLWGRKARWA